MGNYFVMSMRFNKSNASDFGLIPNDARTAINPKDMTLWIKSSLYDFGWGKENGFYKAPLPDFNTLFELALYSTNRDDMYGAAAIILDNYADALLIRCEMIANDFSQKKEFKKLVELFKLNLPINRSSVIQKTYEQIQCDYLRWKKISEVANNI